MQIISILVAEFLTAIMMAFWQPASTRLPLLLFILITFSDTSGQSASFAEFGQINEYGLTGGFTNTGFTTPDSTGFSGAAMPFGGLYLALSPVGRFGLTAGLQYSIYGVNRKSPYERYRYHYLSPSAAIQFRVNDFLSIEGGYRYAHPSRSKLLLLNGKYPSGIERREIAEQGGFGQCIVGGNITFTPSTSINLSYGIPTRNTPLKHIQIGIKVNLLKRSTHSGAELERRIQTGIAEEHVKDLKAGILLVRLRSMQNTIDQLESAGLLSEAAKLREDAKKENEEILQAFSKYNFSDLYFFYDHASGLVKEGKTDSVLLDHNLRVIPPLDQSGKIFIAEFGEYHSDERSSHVRHDFQYLKENKIAFDSSAAWITYGHRGFGIGGIVVMDMHFTPLKAPFPVFTPITNRTLFRSEKKLERAVLKLNEDLKTFYHTTL